MCLECGQFTRNTRKSIALRCQATVCHKVDRGSDVVKILNEDNGTGKGESYSHFRQKTMTGKQKYNTYLYTLACFVQKKLLTNEYVIKQNITT